MMPRDKMADMLDEIFKAFKIDAYTVGISQAEHFYSIFIKLEKGVRIKKLEGIATEIQMELGFGSKPIFMIVPEHALVRMVCADSPRIINLSEVKSALPRHEYNCQELRLALGLDFTGKPLELDLVQCPHLIVAGATGSGKSVFLHTIIENIRALNDQVEVWLADPKLVEFSIYNKELENPKSFIKAIRNDYESIVGLLYTLERIVDHRFKVLASEGVRGIEAVAGDEYLKMHRIVCIIDEVADLMIQDRKNKLFEGLVCRIAAKSRAAGVHLILATQRPSADVITGLIKANFPVRIAFKVASGVDSRVVLDTGGAENLLGRGDGLMSGYSDRDLVRFQSAMPQKIAEIAVPKPQLKLVK